MSLPEIAGHDLQELIGSGCCGAVYRARAADGQACAVKVFSSMAINRKVLGAVSRTLAAMPPHPGVVRPLAYGFERSPYFWSQPLYGKAGKDGHGRAHWEVETLEDWCQEGVTVERAWKLIDELTHAVAWLHQHGIPHGNLRPCNVLVEAGAESPLRVTDMAQGWVGGIHHLDLGDHFVYLCPEQAEHPEGVFSGRGPGWDVYSFGVIAFRLLTGRLPRADAAWEEQLELAQGRVVAGLSYHIESDRLLAAVRSEPMLAWPTAAADAWEERRRAVIERALCLESAQRWSDLREVAREFERIEADFLLEESRAQTVRERLWQADRVRRLTRVTTGLAAVLTLTTGYAGYTAWRLNAAERTLAGQEAAHALATRAQEEKAAAALREGEEKLAGLTQERDAALASRRQTETLLRHAQGAVDQFLTQLLHAPVNDASERAFSEAQLREALAFCERSLKTMEGEAEAGVERARTLGNLGRIHLRLREDEAAEAALVKAREECGRLVAAESGTEKALHELWRGRFGMLLAELKQRRGDGAGAHDLLAESAPQLQAGLAADPKNGLARLECARAWLDLGGRAFERGEVVAARGALEKVAEVLETAEPGDVESAFLRERGAFQLGMVMREEGKLEEALNQMIDAVRAMGELVMGSSPRNQDQALALAEAYTVLAELVGQHFSGEDALAAHQQAVPILLELNRLLPEWAEVKFLLARNQGAIAQLERDLVKGTDAVRKKQDAIELINEVLADAPEHPQYLFLQARLRGEYAGFLADAGKASEAVAMAKLAVATLEKLVAGRGAAVGGKLPPEQRDWEVQLAQVYGLMGHASEKAGMKEAAREALTKAAEQWGHLKEAGCEEEVVKQGLVWTEDRLKKLK